MNGSDNLHIEWLVACLSPGDIAPHRNFKSDSAKGAELLALVVQFQWQEFETYRDLAEDRDDGEALDAAKGNAVPDAARLALESTTIVDGLRLLVDSARDEQLAFGQRTAAALLAAAASNELDRPAAYLDLLTGLASLIENSTVGTSASRSLAVGALLQQSAQQAFQAGRRSDARTFADRAIAVLAEPTENWDDFAVSRGISWTATTSQARLNELITANAKSLLITTSGHLDRSWTELVRAPFPDAATRSTRDALSAITTAVDEIFKKTYSLTSRRNLTLGGMDNILSLLYSALLNAELSGNMASTTRLRQTLGNVLAIKLSDKSPDLDWHEAVIRLFRQSNSKDHLGRFLDHLRVQGYFNLLRDTTERLIDIRNSQGFATASDLILIERSADFVSTEHSDRALRLTIDYASQDENRLASDSQSPDWSRIETALKTASSIIAGNDKVDMEYIASSVLSMAIFPSSGSDQLVFAALVDLASNINWRMVSSETRAHWLELIGAASTSPHVLTIDCIRAYAALDAPQPRQLLERLNGLEHVAALVSGLLGKPAQKVDLDKAVTTATETLRSIQQDAANGAYSGYAWSPFFLAAYLVTAFDRSDLWSPLVSALSDPNVTNEGKIEALHVLTSADSRLAVPPAIRAEFASISIPWPSAAPASMFLSLPEGQFDAACRRFYLAIDFLTPEEIQTATLRDVGSSHSSVRIETAKNCFAAASKSPSLEWPQILLIQLSHDRESSVMWSASRWLAQLSLRGDLAVRGAVAERVISLLADPGIGAVLNALQGLASATRNSQVTPDRLWCEEDVQLVANSHASRTVRAAANSVLELYRAPN